VLVIGNSRKFETKKMIFTARFLLILLIIQYFLLSCSKSKEIEVPDLFKLLPKERTGVDFTNQLTDTPALNILSYLYYYNGAGVAAGDLNNDGKEDLFFASNMQSNRIYLNKGNLQFTDISKEAKIMQGGWSTGVTMVDINADGWLDIYVCQVALLKGIQGKNRLYVNQGLNENGIPTFIESAAAYGLDFSGYATQAAFFDYDLDGDLDVYLLNHSVHPNRNYGQGNQRKVSDPHSGDKLFRNEGNTFIDVTGESGIFSGKIGYGLGVGISDINNDGYPDIYVGNDFYENDYLYINQKNGRFKEQISEDKNVLGHTTHFSMGNDLADFNNDGAVDILSMDMLPEDLVTYKASGNEFNYDIYQSYLKNGYAPQYMQNTLHLNRKNGYFSEIAYLSGIAASEWSWSGLFTDFDNDGFKDIFISNGIFGATNDMDYISFISSENIQRRLDAGMTAEDMAMINEIPQKKIPNYFFKNNGDLTFSKIKSEIASFSNGSVYADLDNDGDMDLVTNNLNQPAFIYQNQSYENGNKNNFLKISFEGSGSNRFGIGARVIIYTKDKELYFENFLSRGYMSSVSPVLTAGLGPQKMIDSMKIIWPGDKFQVLKEVTSNQKIVLRESEATSSVNPKMAVPVTGSFEETNDLISFGHFEYDSYEFGQDPLAPFMSSHLGPKIAVGDINNDGLQDVFIGNGKKQKASLFVQQKSGQFISGQEKLMEELQLTENTDNLFFDADGDGYQDLIIVNGGNEFETGMPLRPILLMNRKGSFVSETNRLPEIFLNGSVVRAGDIDNDGDLDLFIGGGSVPKKYGEVPNSYLLENNGKGFFSDVTTQKAKDLQKTGLVRDAVWVDLNKDGFVDLVVVGHWMPITIFMNHNGTFQQDKNKTLQNTGGLWNTLQVTDLDNDGDMDFIAGNWGLNTKFAANRDQPMHLYLNDFDKNGKQDPIITYFYHNKETVFANKDELVKQLPFLNKKFLSYQSFAKATFKELVPADLIKQSVVKKIDILTSVIVKNNGNLQFEIQPLPAIAQLSSTHAILVDDFDRNGKMDMFLGGNDYQVNTQLGQLDASQGSILTRDDQGKWILNEGLTEQIAIPGAIRDAARISVNGQHILMISRNNDKLKVIKLK